MKTLDQFLTSGRNLGATDFRFRFTASGGVMITIRSPRKIVQVEAPAGHPPELYAAQALDEFDAKTERADEFCKQCAAPTADEFCGHDCARVWYVNHARKTAAGVS